MRRALATAIALHGLGLGASACRAPPASDGLGMLGAPPACPRDAAVDRSGKCACTAGRALVLGACVDPAVADGYCGPAAHLGPAGGCVFKACGEHEVLEVDGACVPVTHVAHASGPCTAPASLVVTGDGTPECVPAGVACPRGTRLDARQSEPVCVAPPSCPPGAVWTGSECRAVVAAGAGGRPVVDVGRWAALVLGASGGPGTAELCRPLALRPDAFGLSPGEEVAVGLSVVLLAPDQDVSGVYAEVNVSAELRVRNPAGKRDGQTGPPDLASPGGGKRLVSRSAEAAARRAATSLVETLRGLGGQASSAAVAVEVRCPVASL